MKLDADDFQAQLRHFRRMHPKPEVREQLIRFDDDIEMALRQFRKLPSTDHLRDVVGVWTAAYQFLVRLTEPAPTPPTSGTPELPETESLELKAA